MRKALAGAVLLLAAVPAAAGPPEGHLDLFYVPSAKLEADSPAFGRLVDEGDGFGVKGMAPLSENTVFTGEYQSVQYDRGTADNTQFRVGAGFIGERGGGLLLEYIDAKDLFDATGIGAHLRLGGPRFYGQVGYVSLNDDFEEVSGLEWSAGMALTGHDGSGIFVEVRRTALEGQETHDEIEVTDARVGARVAFGR